MTDIKPCTVKGCRETQYHHHYHIPGGLGVYGCDDSCATVAAPRLTRKALNARIAALEAENADLIKRGWADEKVICDLRAENADLFAEIADKKDRLARCEGGPVRVEVASPAEVAREIDYPALAADLRAAAGSPPAEAYHGRLVELHFSDGHPKTCGMCDDCCQCCDVDQPDPEGVYLTVRLDDSAARVHSGTVTVTYDPPKDGQ